jgi:hypothetical protein
MHSKTSWQEFIEYDFMSTALFAGSVISLLLGINSGGSIHPWKSASTISPIVIGALGLVAFGFYVLYFSNDSIKTTVRSAPIYSDPDVVEPLNHILEYKR